MHPHVNSVFYIDFCVWLSEYRNIYAEIYKKNLNIHFDVAFIYGSQNMPNKNIPKLPLDGAKSKKFSVRVKLAAVWLGAENRNILQY